jgi:hypothetical protein
MPNSRYGKSLMFKTMYSPIFKTWSVLVDCAVDLNCFMLSNGEVITNPDVGKSAL